MLSDGLDIETASKYPGLSVADIETFLNNKNNE